MAKLEKSVESGLHTEQLSGRTQQVFFSSEEGENYFYPYNGYEVDFNKKAEFDAKDMAIQEINLKIREMMKEGYGCLLYTSPSPRD